MDELTLRYYASRAAEAALRYESGDRAALWSLLAETCPPGTRALDVGCGTGRDVAFLRSRGVEASGVDASPAMIAEARRRHPEIASYLAVDVLPGLATLAARRFDAVLATAVFMHLPRTEADAAAARLAQLPAPGGAVLLSIPATPRGSPADRRDADGRLFEPWSGPEARAVFERHGLRLDAEWRRPDACGRADCEWLTLRFRAPAR